MSNKILEDIKKMLPVNDEWFDGTILVFINRAISILRQIGSITIVLPVNADTIWSDIVLTEDHLSEIQTYIYIRVKLVFDPPQNQYLVDALAKEANEIEARLLNEQ